MKFSPIIALSLVVGLSAGQSSSKLKSSAFGLAGQNATFDYVVSFGCMMPGKTTSLTHISMVGRLSVGA